MSKEIQKRDTKCVRKKPTKETYKTDPYTYLTLFATFAKETFAYHKETY